MRWTTTAMLAVLLLGVGPGSAHAQTVPELTPQDYMEIEQLYSQYYHAIDSGDAEAWAAVFTPDGVFNNVQGHEALKDYINNGTAQGTPMRHWVTNLLLTPVPGGVEGKIYVIQFNIDATPITAATYSRYDDLLVETADGWRFKVKGRSDDTTIGRRR